ncbi:hypothetical protein C8R44DRAFT_768560 [Mycena epipterygia]|nr:hypothetical protein C8R44DRAFT_768560 [Mycena epipterygia]
MWQGPLAGTLFLSGAKCVGASVSLPPFCPLSFLPTTPPYALPSLTVTLVLFLPSSFVAISLPSLTPRLRFSLPADTRRHVPHVRARRQRRHRRHARPTRGLLRLALARHYGAWALELAGELVGTLAQLTVSSAICKNVSHLLVAQNKYDVCMNA